MKYCKKCKHTYDDAAAQCDSCRRELSDLTDETTPVYLISADGFERQRIEAALEHNGIPFEAAPQRKSFSPKAVTGQDVAACDILVPYELHRQAYDLMIGIGAVTPEGEEVIEADEPVEYEEPKEMSPAKRTTIKIVSALLLIILFCLVIWGTDYFMGWIKGLFF